VRWSSGMERISLLYHVYTTSLLVSEIPGNNGLLRVIFGIKCILRLDA
jgi:hypothetical protein